MSNETDLLTRTLRDHSEQMTGSSLDLGDVKARARSIRRRRQAVTGAVAAVVLAVAAPVAITVTDAFDARPVPPASQTETPNPDRTDNAKPEPSGPIPANGAAAPRGDDPAIAYLETGTLRTADDVLVNLERRYAQITQYADGWIATRADTGTTHVLDAAGEVVESWPGGDVAVSPNGDFLATVLNATGGVDVQLRPVTGTSSPLSHTVAFEGTVDIVGFVGPEEIAYTLTDANGGTEVFVTDFLHDERRVDGALSASGASAAAGTVTVMTSYDELEPGSCWAVQRIGDGRKLWETCDYTLETFSPDGRYVIGTDDYHDGIGGSTVAILDAADGTVLAHFTTRDLGFTTQAVWESDSAVLLISHQGDAWYLLRLLPDGTVERALDPIHADEMAGPWALPARP
jgi:hypothetical protein